MRHRVIDWAVSWDVKFHAPTWGINIRRMVPSARRWTRRRGDRVCRLAVVLTVVGLAVLQSSLVWHWLAGERIRLTQSSQAQSAHTAPSTDSPRRLTRDLVRSRKAAAPSAPTRPAATSWTPASTLNGTTIAVALITFIGSLAILIVRAVLRRRPQSREPADSGVDDQEAANRDPTSTEAEQVIASPQGPSTPSTTVEPSSEPGDHDRTDGAVASNRVVPGAPTTDAAQATNRSAGTAPDNGTDGARGTSDDQRGDLSGVGSQGTNSYRVTIFDRRLTERVAYESNARIQWDGHDIDGTTIDLAMAGVGCRLSRGLPLSAAPAVGTTVRVTLLLNGALGVFEARVQWAHLRNEAPVVGLMFLRLQESQRALLQPVVLEAAS